MDIFLSLRTTPIRSDWLPAQALRKEVQTLRDEVVSLRSQLSEARALPPAATPERIDRALEVEMQAAAGDGVMVKAARWLENRLWRK